MKKTLSNIFALLLLAGVLNMMVVARYAEAVDTLSITSLHDDQDASPTTCTTVSGTHIFLVVSVLSRGSGQLTTAVSWNGTAMTQIMHTTTAVITANDNVSVWILPAPSVGSFAPSITSSAPTIRYSCYEFAGADQTIADYTNTNIVDDTTSTAHAEGVTTQYNNAWVVGYVPNNAGTLTADSNSAFPNANSYIMGYTPNAQTPVGLHKIGYTNSTAANFEVFELIPFGASKGGAGCGFGFCFIGDF